MVEEVVITEAPGLTCPMSSPRPPVSFQAWVEVWQGSEVGVVSEGLDCEPRENRKGRKVKQGEATSFMFNRLENPHRDKGIVRGPIQPFENQTRADPNVLKDTYHLVSRISRLLRRRSRDGASPLFAPIGANGGKFNDQGADDVDSGSLCRIWL